MEQIAKEQTNLNRLCFEKKEDNNNIKELKSNGWKDQSLGTPRLPGVYPVNSAAHCLGKRDVIPSSESGAFQVVIVYQSVRWLILRFSIGHLLSGCYVPCGGLSSRLQWEHGQRRRHRLLVVGFVQLYHERVLPVRQFGQCVLERPLPQRRVHRALYPSTYETV